MTNAEEWFNIALRPRKPEGSLGRTAPDGHLDSHTAPELSGDAENWGYKTPTQSKKDKGQERKVKGSWPETCIQYTRLH